MGERWREAVGSRTGIRGPLLRSVDRHSKLNDFLSAKAVNDIVKRRAQMAGLTGCSSGCWTPTGVCATRTHENNYSAYSLRAGGATIAYMNNAPISTICRLGRWKEGSRVVLGYIRAVDLWKDHPFRGVL